MSLIGFIRYTKYFYQHENWDRFLGDKLFKVQEYRIVRW